MDERTLKDRVADFEQQAREVADYLCSRGDTMPLRGQVEAQARSVLNALAHKGWKIVRADLAAAREAAAYERAASHCKNLRGLGMADVSLTGPMRVGEAIAEAIRALATDDQTAALEAVKQEARNEALRKATVMELLEELKNRHDPPVTGLEKVNMIEKGQNHE